MNQILSWDSFVELVKEEIELALQSDAETTIPNPGVSVSHRLHGVFFRVCGVAFHIRPERLHLGVEVAEIRFPTLSNAMAVINGVSCHFIPSSLDILKTINDGDPVECVGCVGGSASLLPPINWLPSPTTGQIRIGITMSTATLGKGGNG